MVDEISIQEIPSFNIYGILPLTCFKRWPKGKIFSHDIVLKHSFAENCVNSAYSIARMCYDFHFK